MAISDSDRPKKASFLKIRFLVVLMATLCPVVCYISRQNLSIAIVAMVKDTSTSDEADKSLAIDQQHNSNNNIINTNLTTVLAATIASLHQTQLHEIDTSKTCPPQRIFASDGREQLAPKIISYGPKYNWSSSDRSLIFEAFFWTYVVCQIPAARLAEMIGAKWILATATLGSSLLSLLSPWAASIHPYAMAFVRALMGISQTALYPACYVLLTRWLPPTERSQAIPILGASAYVGSIITSIATGYFSEQKALGWEYAFYMPSCLCAIWSIFWILLGSSEPRQHKLISLEEIEYIESRMEVRPSDFGDTISKKSISWRKIFKSQAIWAMMAAFLASNWAFTITLLLLPSYLNYVMLIPPFKNGIINSIIYILNVISAPIIGAASALMIETPPFGMSRIQVRKLFQTIGVLSQAICFISLPIIGCDTNLVLAVLYTQVVLFSFVNGGEVQVPAELSLDFAGTIYAIGNCVGSTTGFLVPRVHSWIVDNYSDRSEWTVFFYVATTITTLGGLIFLFFGNNEQHDFSKDICDSDIDCYKSNLERGLSMDNFGAHERTKIKTYNTKYVT